MSERNSTENAIESWIKKIKDCESKGHDLKPLTYIVTSRSDPLRDKGGTICRNCGMGYERPLTPNELKEIHEFQKY